MDSTFSRPSRVANALSRWLPGLLDLVIAGYSIVLLVILATGGVTLGFISINGAAKPILVLLLLVPLRLTLGEPFWFGKAAPTRLERCVASARRKWDESHAVADVASALIPIAATFFIAFLADLFFSPYSTRAFAMPFAREKLAQLFAGWDSGWYFDIARRGYYFDPEGQSSVAFFPLYPVLMRAAAWPFGGTERAVWTAGIIISCLAFLVALVVIHRFTVDLFGEREVARRAVLYMAIFPFAFFFTRVYAESLFLLTSVLAIKMAHDGRWWSAGVWGALATLCRPNGILIGLPLALLVLNGSSTAAALARRSVALLPLPLALGGYCAYVYTLSGNPLAWLSAQDHWGYSLGHPPWEQLLKVIARMVKYGFYDYFFVSKMAPFRLFHGGVALLFLALTPAVFKRLGAPMGAYVLVSLLIPLSGNALEGVGRYSAVLFPVFMLMGNSRSSRLHEGIVMVFCLLLALFVALFATGRPIY